MVAAYAANMMTSRDSPRPVGDTIAIQYIPGVDKASRVSGRENLIAVFFFLACCIAGLGFGLYKLVLLMNELPKSAKKKRVKQEGEF
jgi:hypothetical protein